MENPTDLSTIKQEAKAINKRVQELTKQIKKAKDIKVKEQLNKELQKAHSDFEQNHKRFSTLMDKQLSPMWKKIDSEDDLKRLRPDRLLIKYPIDGEPVDSLKLTDIKNLLRYELHSVNRDTRLVELKWSERDIPNPSVLLGIGHVQGILGNPPVLNKKLNDFITDKVWWIER